MNKQTNTKKEAIVKGSAIALAGVMAVSFFPVIAITSAGDTTSDKAIYLSAGASEINTGSEYKVGKACWGSTGEKCAYTVTYASTGKTVSVSDNDDNDDNDVFTADKSGTYVITYSYTDGEKTYTLDYEVKASISTAKIEFEDNHETILPTIYDLSYDKVKDGENFKNIDIPLPIVKNEDGEEVKNVTFSAKGGEKVTDGVEISVVGPNGKSVSVQKNGDEFYIAGSEFNGEKAGIIGEYSIKYKYYAGGKFITSTTKSFTVKAGYYRDYELKATNADPATFVTGVETDVPTISATATFKNSVNAETTEAVNVKYSVSVKFKENGKWVDSTGLKDYKFTAPKNGEYRLCYAVTDFYGNTVSLKNITFTASDSKKPEVFIYDASDTTNYVDGDLSKINEYVDATSKLKTKTNVKNVVVYAIGAKDNASKTSNMTFKRVISNSSSATIEVKDYADYNLIFNYDYESAKEAEDLLGAALKALPEKTAAAADTYLQEHKFLKVVYKLGDIDNEKSFAYQLKDAGIEVDSSAEGYSLVDIKDKMVKWGYAYIPSTHEIEDGKYTIKYSAEDEAGNSTALDSVTMEIVNDVVDSTEGIKLTIKTNFADSYAIGDTIKFEKPVAEHEIDKKMDVVTTYEFLSDEKVTLGDVVTIKDDYSITLKNLPEGAAYVEILAKTSNDFNQTAEYTKTIKIAEANDSKAPTISEGDSTYPNWTELKQGEVVTLPTVVYKDDYVALMNAKVEVNFVKDSKEIAMEVFDSQTSFDKLAGTYTLAGGKVKASMAGTYNVQITAIDPANNIISSYYSFIVNAVEEPEYKVLSSSLDNKVQGANALSSAINGDGTAVTGERIYFDVPTVSYSGIGNKKIFGLEEGTNAAMFYSIKTISGPSIPRRSGNEITFVIDKEGTYEFQSEVTFFVCKDEATYDALASAYNTSIAAFNSKVGELGSDVEKQVKKGEVKQLVVSANEKERTYTINFGEEGDYNESYAKDSEIVIYSVGGDKNIDKEKSKITISCSGSTSSPTKTLKLSDFANDSVSGFEGFDDNGNIKFKLQNNGTYTISYKIVNTNGEEYTPANGKSSYTLRVGDSEKPQIEFAEGFLESEYVLKEIKDGKISLDISKIILTDNGVAPTGDDDNPLLENLKIKLYRSDDDGNLIEIENIGDAESQNYTFKIENTGEYTLKVSTKDSVGWTGSAEKTFTVNAEGKEASVSTKTVGIILIVISALILAGVIAYFVISRVKANKKSSKKKEDIKE